MKSRVTGRSTSTQFFSHIEFLDRIQPSIHPFYRCMAGNQKLPVQFNVYSAADNPEEESFAIDAKEKNGVIDFDEHLQLCYHLSLWL